MTAVAPAGTGKLDEVPDRMDFEIAPPIRLVRLSSVDATSSTSLITRAPSSALRKAITVRSTVPASCTRFTRRRRRSMLMCGSSMSPRRRTSQISRRGVTSICYSKWARSAWSALFIPEIGGDWGRVYSDIMRRLAPHPSHGVKRQAAEIRAAIGEERAKCARLA